MLTGAAAVNASVLVFHPIIGARVNGSTIINTGILAQIQCPQLNGLLVLASLVVAHAPQVPERRAHRLCVARPVHDVLLPGMQPLTSMYWRFRLNNLDDLLHACRR